MLPPYLHPHFIKFEKPKKELYLTLSAKPIDSEDICQFQNNIEDIIKKFLPQEMIVKNSQNLKYKIQDNKKFLYMYPREGLHFSIVNFLTFNIGNQNFDESRKLIQETNTYTKALEKLKLFKSRLGRDCIETEINRIYLPGGLENSISLNVFPRDKKFLEKLKEEGEYIKKEMDEELVNNDFKIKAYPSENFKYFSLNIFRFISGKGETEIINGLYEKIVEMNKELEKNPIDAKMKIAEVVSDPYLANSNP